MNLEQIDTSTTAGKAEVMRLAVEGRRIAIDYQDGRGWQVWGVDNDVEWNWASQSFAIIAEPIGMEEIWVVVGFADGSFSKEAAKSLAAERPGTEIVRYIRADLGGEVS